jgi:protein-S-isoprenylcysteine O-methyltransferase Ste14
VLQLLAGVLPWVATLCAAAVLSAVAANFALAARYGQARQVQRSPVATATMVAFFIGIYELVHLRLGVVPIPWPGIQAALMLTGMALLVIGAAVNITGRFNLGRNWADQATVYDEQQLVTTGAYGVVRHPLYASLIWMFLGASLAYANAAALLATALLFIPAMYYRAGLEERLLRQAFPDYAAYQRRVGMLFPQVRRTRQ